MANDDLPEGLGTPINDLRTHYMVYVRAMDFENGYNIMFSLNQNKETKAFEGTVRLRRPDGEKPFIGHITSEKTERSEAIQEFIVHTTSFASDVQKSGLPKSNIVHDRSWEFPDYGEDMDLLMSEIEKSDIFDITKIPIDDSKNNPSG